jgi:hypothetical protein
LFSLAVSAPTAALGQAALPAMPIAFLVMVAFGVPVSGGAGTWRPSDPGSCGRWTMCCRQDWPPRRFGMRCISPGTAPQDAVWSWRCGLPQGLWLWWFCRQRDRRDSRSTSRLFGRRRPVPRPPDSQTIADGLFVLGAASARHRLLVVDGGTQRRDASCRDAVLDDGVERA